MNNKSLASAFTPDMTSASQLEAPTFVSRVTAAVLGALITAQVLNFNDGFYGDHVVYCDRVIAEALDKVIDVIDIAELERANNARYEAKHGPRFHAAPHFPVDDPFASETQAPRPERMIDMLAALISVFETSDVDPLEAIEDFVQKRKAARASKSPF